ncbi:hypothetical protein ACFQX7_05715 [Luedemannella flava]
MPPIWRDAPSPYGPLATLVSHAAAGLAGDRLAVAVGVLRAAALLGVVLAAACGGRLRAHAACRSAGPRGWAWPPRWSCCTRSAARTTTRS